MTWWALNKQFLPFFILFFFIFSSCEQSDDIGLGLGNFNEVGVVFTDTFSVETSTILLDSVVTDQSDLLMIGQYQDPKFGVISARSFMEFIPLIDTFALEASNPVIDSVVLILPHTYNYGSTIGKQNFEVYRLTGDFNDSLNFNNTIINSNATLLNKDNLPFEVNTQDIIDQTEIGINLDKTFGEELINIIQNNLGTNVSDFDFTESFKGLVVGPSNSDNAAILGFAPLGVNFRLNIHYHQDGESESFLFQFFPNIVRSFSNIQGDKSGTVIENLSLSNSLSINETGNELYLQSGLGIVPKIEFPFLQDFVEDNSIIINRAVLVFYPAELESEEFPYPTTLTLLELDQDNKTVRDIDNNWQFVQVNGVNPFSNVQPVIFEFDEISGSYRAEITLQLQLMLNGQKEVSALAIREQNNLVGPNPNVLFNQISTRRLLLTPFNSNSTDGRHLKLELFFTRVESN